MGNEPKQDHIIPQLLLRNFTDPDGPQGKRAQLWAYNLMRREWINTSPRNVGKNGRYYAWCRPDGTWERVVDAQLQLNETAFGAVLHEKLLKYKPLSPDDRNVTLLFLVNCLLRAQRLHAEIEGVLRRAVQENRRETGRLPANWGPTERQMIKEYRELTGNALANDNEIWASLHALYSEDRKVASLSAVGVAPDVHASLSRAQMMIVVSPPGEHFILSDNPVSVVDRAKVAVRRPALFAKDTEYSLPLGRNLLLYVGRNFPQEGLEAVTVDEYNYISRRAVPYFNLVTISRAQEWIYAPKRSFPGGNGLDMFGGTEGQGE